MKKDFLRGGEGRGGAEYRCALCQGSGRGAGEEPCEARHHRPESLISYFPRAYEDRRESRRIAELQVGERACVTAMVASEPKLAHPKGIELVKLRVVDESAALELTYFNQSYLKNTFHVGESYTFYGTVEGTLLRRTMTNPSLSGRGCTPSPAASCRSIR